MVMGAEKCHSSCPQAGPLGKPVDGSQSKSEDPSTRGADGVILSPALRACKPEELPVHVPEPQSQRTRNSDVRGHRRVPQLQDRESELAFPPPFFFSSVSAAHWRVPCPHRGSFPAQSTDAHTHPPQKHPCRHTWKSCFTSCLGTA